ncbi:MAG: copper transporter [Flavobacteriales bacterium CG18_big_fil_WC_8_21_14_2_50_32_9]|nr:efflux RND transporter permease subunit [Flavobacteriales bacterium]PIQ14526.1 MAG: copper transporter [Flavobacteriales bacterium CG18_big_fil_WC_8_21_14_2_50_32_9]PJC62457.1 MAG: copper transporter [Flavobacteriales bacterium CG_4_9_14_0_2_um_filter_32_27]
MAKSKKIKEFAIASWAIDNKMTIYLMIAILLITGISAYYAMPRESFPEVKETKIYISSVFPGNTSEDMEKLITNPIEEELQNLSDIIKITSTSQEDYSIITVEFGDRYSVEEAKSKVKDKVDIKKASSDWPTFNGSKIEPKVFDLNIAEEMPIININISGDYPVEKLKEYAEYLEKKIELLAEIKQADIRGAQEKEVEIALDVYKMTASKVSFDDVINTISRGNTTISAGNMVMDEQRRTIRVIGEIEEAKELNAFVVKNEHGAVYLRDIASIAFKEKEKTTYARSFGNPVVMLDVKKLSGKNMIEAVEKIKVILEDAKTNYLPKDLSITTSNDQSTKTINQVNDLVNNIIFGILLVVGVLMFFLGFRNALFVGFAIPMSMFMSFTILNLIGYTLNTMVLFALVMGLGMLVDNGIVVVENVLRLMQKENMSRIKAAKRGIGEIATPIIISTATTVAAFVPLGFWPGIMGNFMKIFPITLSIVLGSSLFVALLINSMLTSDFMKTEEKDMTKKFLIKTTSILFVLGVISLFIGNSFKGLGTLMIFSSIILWVYKLFLVKAADYFQTVLLVKMENGYQKFLSFALKGKMPYLFLFGTIGLLFLSFVVFAIAQPKVEFFPDNEPNQVFVYIEYPEGTDISKTNRLTKEIEQKVYAVANNYKDKEGYNYLVESAVSQVGEGAGNPQTDGGSNAEMPHKGKITVSLRESKLRRGKNSKEFMEEVRDAVGSYPGVNISIEKEAAGPPSGYPLNIEIRGKDYNELISTAKELRDAINKLNIPGIEGLKIDVNKSKPVTEVTVDRKKAGELGISVGQVGSQLRRSLFGEKASVYKKDGEDYDVYVRFDELYKHNTNTLYNQRVVFRDPSNGQIKDIPISTLITTNNTSSYTAIKHRDLNRIVTLYSSVKTGYNANEIVGNVKSRLSNFETPAQVDFYFTGQMEEQEKNMSFLMTALFSGLGLILFLLVLQFNSFSKPLIVLMAIVLSFIGVLFGLVIFNMTFVIMMTMVGIISLAGIVVNNGVVLLDYTELLVERKKQEIGISKKEKLPVNHLFDVIVEGGSARLRPVLLTAITTVFGLIPLAIGLNIDFFSLFSEWDANVYIGGDNVIFWGPLAWTVIFGLTFATFLTLVIVPVSYFIVEKLKLRLKRV